MASRRSRIKGIANIPQRRKATNEENKLNLTESEAGENEKPSENKDAPLDNSNTGNSISNDAIEINLPKPEALTQIVKETFNNGVTNIKNEAQQNSKDCDKNLTPATEPPKPATEPPKPATEPPKPTNILKRKFIKAPVSLNAIKNRKKPYQESLEKGVDTQVNETVETNKNKVLGNFEQSSNNDLACTVNKEFIKNEEVSAAHDIQNQLPKEDNIGNLFQKPVPLFSNIQHSDTEYPLPPPSPNKANRSRIKAIPRLAQRKHSFSASESEDESRKINRIRNDSVCSTTSMVAEPITECFSPQRTRDPVFTTQVKKVVARSEQTRKLAEDRIDFYRRFGAKKPERHRLKMADLIFYNPESNPMTNEENIKNNEEPMEEMVDDPNGEAVDDPIKKDITKSDEENEMPVPQIKIGPSGEIILDEQSLVVERKEVQRQREEMEKTKILDADRMKTGYGIYKKHKRTKAWSHEETIMFYTVLNTVGTDFMAVTEFFPNRSRRDVKAKFKKEEKINRHLIDKALGEPYRFDIDDLKHDIDAKIREQEELRRQKAMEAKLKEDRQKELLEIKKREIERRKLMIPKPSNNKNHADDAINVKEEIKPIAKETKEIEKTAIRKKEIPQGTEGPKVTLKKEIHHKPKPKKPRKEKQLSMKMFMSDSDADESDLATQSESDDDVILSHKPTRSGRVPKLTQRYEDEVSLNSLIKEKENSRIPKRAELKNVEPGSVMIITEDGPNGEPIYKIFMVTPEQQATPLNIPSDDVAKVIQLRKGFTAHNIMTISANATTDEEDENSVENNFTIPEDENVTTLKSCDENSVDMVSEQNVTIPADASVTTLRSRVDNDTVENVIPEQNVTIAADASVTTLKSRVDNDTVENVILEQNVTIPEDASVTNLRSRVDSDTVENDLTYDISSPQGPLHDDDLQANVGNGDINAYSENIKIIATEPIILDNPTASTVSDSVCFIGDEKSENLNESNIQISVANTEERTEKFKVLATESSVLDDSGIQENFIVLDTQQSDLPINTEIVFRVNNDGMCSKELNEDDEQPLHQAPLNNVEMSVDS